MRAGLHAEVVEGCLRGLDQSQRVALAPWAKRSRDRPAGQDGGGLGLLHASAARSDLLTRRLRNPFGFLRIRTRTGKLRRQIAETRAVLAADHDRQDRVWKAAQQLAVSGEFSDANTVGNVGHTLAKKGYAPSLARQISRLCHM